MVETARLHLAVHRREAAGGWAVVATVGEGGIRSGHGGRSRDKDRAGETDLSLRCTEKAAAKLE